MDDMHEKRLARSRPLRLGRACWTLLYTAHVAYFCFASGSALISSLQAGGNVYQFNDASLCVAFVALLGLVAGGIVKFRNYLRRTNPPPIVVSEDVRSIVFTQRQQPILLFRSGVLCAVLSGFTVLALESVPGLGTLGAVFGAVLAFGILGFSVFVVDHWHANQTKAEPSISVERQRGNVFLIPHPEHADRAKAIECSPCDLICFRSKLWINWEREKNSSVDIIEYGTFVYLRISEKEIREFLLFKWSYYDDAWASVQYLTEKLSPSDPDWEPPDDD